MYQRLLVPIDGSELAEIALDYAKGLVNRLPGIMVFLLHVRGSEERHLAPMRRAYIDQAAAAIRSQAEGAKGELVTGNPAEEILRYADKNDIDLIVMATHGRSGISRWATGSVAYKVLRASKVPVWLVGAGVTEEIIRDKSPGGRILVPMDGSRLSELVLPDVERLAKQWGTGLVEVVLTRVCEPPTISSDYPEAMPLSWEDHVEKETVMCKLEAGPYLAGVEKRLKNSGLRVRSEVLVGKPAEEISSYANDNKFSLITMVIHGRSGISRWAYGSVAEKVMLSASIPVFLVRPQ